MQKINKAYIMEKYDIDKERRDIEIERYKGELCLNFEETMNKQEFREHIDSILNHHPDNILFQYIDGDWNTPDEIIAVEKIMLPETDQDVMLRLVKYEKQDRATDIEIEKAKKLLEDNDFKVS